MKTHKYEIIIIDLDTLTHQDQDMIFDNSFHFELSNNEKTMIIST